MSDPHREEFERIDQWSELSAIAAGLGADVKAIREDMKCSQFHPIPKAEGLSEDNAVKVWLDLRGRGPAFCPSPSDMGPEEKLCAVLTARFLAAEQNRATRVNCST